jgi:hypothetical protein
LLGLTNDGLSKDSISEILTLHGISLDIHECLETLSNKSMIQINKDGWIRVPGLIDSFLKGKMAETDVS